MRRLSSTLSVALLATALLPVAIIGLFGHAAVSDYARSVTREQSSQLAQQVHADIEHDLGRIEQHLAWSFSEQAHPRQATNPALDAWVQTSTAVAALYRVGRNGQIVAVGLPRDRREHRPDLLGVDFSRQPSWVGGAPPTQAGWSNVSAPLSGVGPALQYVLPVEGATLVASVPVSGLRRSLLQHPPASNARVLVVDRRGVVLFDRDRASAQRQRNLNHLDLVAAALGGQSSSGAFELGGQPYLGHAQPLSKIGWVVVAAQPAEIALAPATAVRTSLLTVLLVALGFALLLASGLARSVSQPMRAFVAQAKEIAEGRYEPPLAPQRFEEVEAFAESFRRMVAAIRDREALLRSLSTSLASATGQQCLHNLTEELSRVFAADLAVLARLREGAVEVVCLVRRGVVVDPPLVRTLDPVSRRVAQSPNGLQCVLPSDEAALRTMDPDIRARGLVGSALLSTEGEVIAVLYAVTEGAMPLPPHPEEVFSLLRSRATVELQRQTAEQALRHSEAQFQQLAHSIEEVFWLVRVSDWRLDYVSPAFEEVWGMSAATLRSRPWAWLQAVPKADRRKLLGSLKAVAAGQTPSLDDGEVFQIVRPDGETRWIQGRAYPVREPGRPATHIAGLALDITERHLAEQREQALQRQLTDAQKMEALGTLAGGIAHDFNNVLGAIMGFNEMAMMDVEDQLDPREDLHEVQKAAERARDLVAQILSFSRHEDSVRGPTSVAPLVQETSKLLRASLPSSIELTIDLSGQEQTTVCIAPTRMHQILMNLCTNAGHAMREHGGVLQLNLTTVSLWHTDPGLPAGLAPGDYVELRVTDNGPGIPEAVKARIFEPFFTTKGQGEGTGLGLAVVEGIVRNAGGHISVHSVLGEGTEFRVLLPPDLGTAAASALVPETQPDLPRGTRRILLVDDEVALATWGRKLLSRLGYEVTTTTCSEDALRLLSTDDPPYDLLVSDQTMPKISGLDLATQANLHGIPVIICSGFSTKLTPEVMQHARVSTFLAKPLSAATLALAVSQAPERAPGAATGPSTPSPAGETPPHAEAAGPAAPS